MAIGGKMPTCAALTEKGLLEAIERERAVTEQMALAILLGLTGLRS